MQQVQSFEPIRDPAVIELLKMLNKMGEGILGSDESKRAALNQLKSAVVLYGCPLIFLTINPADRHSPLALLYAGSKIDIKEFLP